MFEKHYQKLRRESHKNTSCIPRKWAEVLIGGHTGKDQVATAVEEDVVEADMKAVHQPYFHRKFAGRLAAGANLRYGFVPR